MNNSRVLSVILVVFLIIGFLLQRLYQVQIVNHDYYTLVADRQQNKYRLIKAERGIIKDANGEVMSFTKDNVSFYVDTRMMNEKKIDKISSLFSKVFHKDKNYYKKLILNGDNNVCLEKKVTMDLALRIKDTTIDGLFYQDDYTRVYPYGSLASHLLGFVNNEMEGVAGIEKTYNDKLAGVDGKYLIERDVVGRPVSVNDNVSRPPVPGDNIILTIKRNYQKILEEELINGLKKYDAKSAVGIIMNPNNSEIYALANVPTYDPANYNLFDADSRRNRALTDTYEPGSTFKSFIMSILFNNNLVKEDEIINTENGEYQYKSVKIKDTHKFSKLTVKEILEQSSNIGMTKLSERINDELLYKSLRDFGFGNPTGIDLPGEASGLLKKPDQFSGLTKAFLSFGYEISVTPLQLITAYSALINGGFLFQPYLVKSITDYKGNLIYENRPVKVRQVISENTSEEMRKLLIGVVEEGTGREARFDDFLVGGKTGTSQKLINNSYSNNQYNSSFVGFLPAENPQLICLILYNSPAVGKYGGLVAAPVFKNVMQRIIESDVNLLREKKKIIRDENLINNFITSKQLKSNTDFFDVPVKNKSLKKNDSFNFANRTTMPSLLNKSIRDAISVMSELGIRYKILGSGKVISQSIIPGTAINKDSICVLQCGTNIKFSSINLN
ncbi:penicillin-binding protein [Melioribacteraceae bacterium 4301-Me]|uniref:penicillin-binding protein n=1 Tax=Pyranulibacter aquaticus TaxID=3163344 RepID=UPI00359554E0